VGFLPVLAASRGYSPLVTGAAVTQLAGSAALIQLRVGRVRDAGRIPDGPGMVIGLGLTAAGLLCAVLLPGLLGVALTAVVLGAGTGLITPLGFAHLASATSLDRLGATLGTAEIGREPGDAGVIPSSP
jgi:hypothetical protein